MGKNRMARDRGGGRGEGGGAKEAVCVVRTGGPIPSSGRSFLPCSLLFSPLSPISPHQREVHFRPVRPILTPVDFMLFEQQKLTRFLLSDSLNSVAPRRGVREGGGTGGFGSPLRPGGCNNTPGPYTGPHRCMKTAVVSVLTSGQ